MAQHKIPAFLSKKFNSSSASEKKELLNQLESWRESGLTKELFTWIDQMITNDEATEDKAQFSSEFETMQDYAWHKGSRFAFRNVKKQLERDE